MSSKPGFVLRDILGKIPDQPVPESLGIRARLSNGAILDISLAKGGQVLKVSHLPGSGQAIGYQDLVVQPQVSNVVYLMAIDADRERGAKVDG